MVSNVSRKESEGIFQEASQSEVEEDSDPPLGVTTFRRFRDAADTRMLWALVLASLLPGTGAQSTSTTPTAPSCTSSGSEAHGTLFSVEAALIPILVIGSGIVSGLTLGYMSLDMTQLSVLEKTGSPKQKKWAQAIKPIRKNGHQLLVSLLLANMILNETLPVISDGVLGGGFQAVVVSTVLIVIFSEIIPQSVCTRFGLQIGAYMVWPTRLILYVFWIIAWPIAKILTKVLGPHAGIIYRRAELKELIGLHSEATGHGGDLKPDTIAIVGSTLDFQQKTASQAMTPLGSVFMLDIDKTRLDYNTLVRILQGGHSRIPVYEEVNADDGGSPTRKILGLVLTKQFILVDPEDAVPLRDLPLHPVPFVPESQPLLFLLNTFQEGRSHLAVVCPAKEGYAKQRTSSFTSTAKSPSFSKPVEKEKSLLRSIFKHGDGAHNPLDTAENGHGQSNGLGEAARSSWASLSGLFLDEDKPMGIITLEDVLEELIGEEILDETDLGADGRRALKPYIPAEAQAATVENPPPPSPIRHNPIPIKGAFVSAFKNPMSRSSTSVARTSLPASKSSAGTGVEDRHVPFSKSTIAKRPSVGTLDPKPTNFLSAAAERLGMSRSRSVPGRTRTSAEDVTPMESTTDQKGSGGGAKVDVPENLGLIVERASISSNGEDAEKDLSRRHSLDLDVRKPSDEPSGPPPPAIPPLLADALLAERGRRKLAAQGQDVAQLNPWRFSPSSSKPPDTAPSTPGTSSSRGKAFKLPQQPAALGIWSRGDPSKVKSTSTLPEARSLVSERCDLEDPPEGPSADDISRQGDGT